MGVPDGSDAVCLEIGHPAGGLQGVLEGGVSAMRGFSQDIAELFRRDLTRLMQEVAAFSDEGALWRTAPGIRNSAGNLALHIEGNLLEYVGRQLGGVPYTRQRDLEFSSANVPAAELVRRIEALRDSIPGIVAELSDAELDAESAEKFLGGRASTRQILISLYAHLNYHLGQIDYLRRFLTEGSAIEFERLKKA